MACLVHERATIKLPGPAPFRAVVIRLRSAPEDVYVHHVYAPEALMLHRALEQLDSRITPILLHDEKYYARIIAGFDECLAVFPTRRHGLFGYYVESCLCNPDPLSCMDPARCSQYDRIESTGLKHTF